MSEPLPITSEETVLEVKGLKTRFKTEAGSVLAVDNVSFHVKAGKTLGLVGESGCGKSVTSLSIMRLIASPPGSIEAGEIFFENRDLLKLPEAEMRKLRGNKMAMIFQEPMTSLNPVFTCGEQIEEAVRLHNPEFNKQQVKLRTLEMLKLVGIPAPESRYKEFPHQLSGGMRQRVMIAMALCCDPKLLIADEPTTALDVTIQAQILDIIKKLQKEMGTAMLLITHDLGVVAEMCDEVAVMYAGKIVEYGSVQDIFYRPKHPYTKGLLGSVPHFETGEKLERLNTIKGMVPSLYNLPQGCRFHDRCERAKERCKKVEPDLRELASSHFASCHDPL